jgi:gamma-glutamyl hercynylcysteine S-oxide synthase
MFRCARSLALSMLFTMPLFAVSQDIQVADRGEQIDGPGCAALPLWNARTPAHFCTENELQKWLDDVRRWRQDYRTHIGFSGADYTRPELAWTASSFVQPQMMVHDRFFYDPATRQYTVSRYLSDLDQRYGGIDSVLVWPVYPNIGVDDRNEYDLFHDLPGGIAGIKSFVDDFHRHGVHVLFPVTLWDQGTRKEDKPDPEALASELAEVGADGVNGDTLRGVPESFRTAANALHHPLALEPELALETDEMMNWNTMSWGYWRYGFVPSVSRYKWIEPRHMVNISDRWAHDHTDDLQFAFFNGTGFESWENIWGIWNQMTPRDAEALRRISLIERFNPKLLVSPEWEPHVAMLQFGVFASKWPGQDSTLWTIVNRNAYPIHGREMKVPHTDGMRYYDLWNGKELHADWEGGMDVLMFPLEANGFGSVLATKAAPANLDTLLKKMNVLSAKPLQSFSHQWTSIGQQIVPIAATKPAAPKPTGMSLIPAANFQFRVNGIEIEGTNDEGVDVQYAGEPSARRYHDLKIHILAFWIDTYPVTNAEFKKFVDATHYSPGDKHNFLKDWKDGSYPEGWQDKPVTWVSLEDARAYASWAGKRLPHEWEWQYAAQGTDQREFPWGNDWIAENAPKPDEGRSELAASDVHAHPAGASPFGVQDIVGNVWQWTDEWTDQHTRAAILRGGSHYQPAGSRWYFPQAYKLSQHGKYLLMAPSLDRSASIGFRCVADVAN